MGNNIVVFSKDSGLGLPVQSTAITASQPCLNPKEYQIASNQSFYVSELRRNVQKCNTQFKFNGTSYNTDPRYLKTGLSISEYNFQSASGVLSKLETLPHYPVYYFPSSSVKKLVNLNTYTR